jgi:acetamidase/formamidase
MESCAASMTYQRQGRPAFRQPQTGPFYVEGAEPGDTLVLHLVELEPARDWGASAAIPVLRRHDEHRPRRHPAAAAS